MLPRADGHDGVPRTVINLANHLVESFDIQIVGLLRGRNETVFEIDPRIDVQHVMDLRPYGPDGQRRNLEQGGVDEHGNPVSREIIFARQQPSAIAPLDRRHWASSDGPLIETLRQSNADVVIGTTPALNRFAGRFAPPGAVKVGQDHLNFPTRTRTAEQREFVRTTIEALDVFVPLTRADEGDYRAMMGDAKTEISAIPNALSWPAAKHPPPLVNKVVVAAGRLEPQKAFDRLIKAYAPLAASRPDWRLDIYGAGSTKPALKKLIDDLGVGSNVTLRGYSRDISTALAQSSIYALSSKFEGFPMVLLEAMSVGLPMVAYDCPRGPAEIVRDGVNGRLVSNGDRPAFTAALEQLMDSQRLRQHMGAASRADAADYAMPNIIERWTKLFTRLAVHPV
ncbi:MAG TPA: glycosyltransferase family 4 protein [Nocardioidaceae bacterium]|nr:glycosyltransferase family 4 protein [Nocardioidaceae bacterium]